ncbi:MAG: thioredoxin domain-containing protein [Planctomycetota bacterium]
MAKLPQHPGAGQLAVAVSKEDHATGAPLADAAAVLVEYGDYECPTCAATQPDVENLLAHFGDRLAFVFRHFPLTTVHPRASVAAQAAEAAAAQGQFWPMHRALYARPGGEATDDLERLALRVGLETYKFNGDITAGTYAARVATDVEGGKASGVSGTPTFFLDGRRLSRDPKEALAEIRHFLQDKA